MYVRLVCAIAHVCVVLVLTSDVAWSQDAGHQHGDAASAPEQEHQHQHDASTMGSGGVPMTRDASGTAWLPDESPMYAQYRQSRGWTFMLHSNAFVQYLKETGDRGSDQFSSVNWLMGMAQRDVGSGRLVLNGMLSAEPGTIPGCGYPDLLATGEECDDQAIHDRQHPHDLFMEISVQYSRPIGGGLRLQLYGGPVGEPAIGPVAFVHRVSALSNPVAPVTHHWFDSTHVTYGVATAGLFTTKWKAEASLFNGREPDENRTNVDLDAMDSWSARFWFVPSSHWAFQLSGASLKEAEAGHDGGPRVDVGRVTASATFHRETLERTLWATTVGWGRNTESGEATNALLFESSVALRDRHVIYGRFEWAQKSGHDLVVDQGHDLFDVTKLQGGYTHYLRDWKGWVPGFGVALSAGVVPQSLAPLYGSRVNAGFGVYLTLRPAVMRM